MNLEKTIRKRTNYFLKNTADKLEIYEGLSKATKSLKTKLFKFGEFPEAKSKLIANFLLSEKQAYSVLDMPLKIDKSRKKSNK